MSNNREPLTEEQKLALKAFGSLASIMAIKWAFVFGSIRLARRLSEKS